MPIEQVNQNFTVHALTISPYLKTIIDNRITGVALTCFQAIVDWLLTTCSCFYPAYNRFYEHQKNARSTSGETAANELLPSTTPQTTSQSSEVESLNSQQPPPSVVEEALVDQSQENCGLPQEIQLPHLTPSPEESPPVNLQDVEEIPTQNLQGFTWQQLTDGFLSFYRNRQTGPFVDTYKEAICNEFPFMATLPIVSIFEKISEYGQENASSFLAIFQTELVQRLDGKNPFDTDPALKQEAQQLLIANLSEELENCHFSLSQILQKWNHLPYKFGIYSFRGAVLLQALAKQAHTLGIHELMNTLLSVEMAYNPDPLHYEPLLHQINNNHPKAAALLIAAPIREMQQMVIDRLGGLNPYSTDMEMIAKAHNRASEIHVQSVGAPYEAAMASQGHENLESLQQLELDQLASSCIQLANQNQGVLNNCYQEVLVNKLSGAPILKIIKTFELSIPPPPQIPGVVTNLLNAELTKRLDGYNLFGDNLHSRQEAYKKLFEQIAPSLQKFSVEKLLNVTWLMIESKFESHSFRSAMVLEEVATRSHTLRNLMDTLDWIQMQYNQRLDLSKITTTEPLLGRIYNEDPTTHALLEAAPIRKMQLSVIQSLGGLNPYSKDPLEREAAHAKSHMLIAEAEMAEMEALEAYMQAP